MTKEETIRLLQVLRSAYPNAKISDPQGIVTAWLMAFGDEPADVIYKSARHHMNVSPFFPTIADIRQSINRGQMLFEMQEAQGQAKLETRKSIINPETTLCDLCGLCDKHDQALCEW